MKDDREILGVSETNEGTQKKKKKKKYHHGVKEVVEMSWKVGFLEGTWIYSS